VAFTNAQKSKRWRDKRNALAQLAEAQLALADANRRHEELAAHRDTLLLDNDDRGLDAVDSELAAVRTAADRQAARIRLLEAAVEQERLAALAAQRAALIARFTKTLAEADTLADAVQADVAQIEKKFRRIVALREEARFMWPPADSHANASAGAAEGAALSGIAVKALLSWEFFRISPRLPLGGRPGEKVEIGLPGGVCPRLEWTMQPEKITPFATALRAASRFAVDMMGGLDPLMAASPSGTGKGSAAVEPAQHQPVADSELRGAQATNGSETPQRTQAEVRLASLLLEQNRLAEDVSEQGEARYQEVVREIVRVQDEITATQRMEQQHG
jgi:hypothetical protein